MSTSPSSSGGTSSCAGTRSSFLNQIYGKTVYSSFAKFGAKFIRDNQRSVTPEKFINKKKLPRVGVNFIDCTFLF